MAERVVRLQTERIADHDGRVGEAPGGTQRGAEIVQRADILGPQPNSLLEAHDGGVVVARIGQEKSEVIVGLGDNPDAALWRCAGSRLPRAAARRSPAPVPARSAAWRRSGRPPLRPAPGQATRQASPASAAASASGKRSRIAARYAASRFRAWAAMSVSAECAMPVRIRARTAAANAASLASRTARST